MINICICGGGSLGHVCAGMISLNKNVNVNVLTNHPEKWNNNIIIYDTTNNNKYECGIHTISNEPKDVIPQSQIVLLCLPGFAIGDELIKIKDYLNPECNVGSIVSNTGFFLMAKCILPKTAKLFGFQRVPYIARVKEYGKSAELLGNKTHLNIATENINDDEFIKLLGKLFDTPISLLNHYYEATLSNSNPILHTARLYSMWCDWNKNVYYKQNTLFYKDWDIKTSEILMKMDDEFMQLVEKLSINKSTIPPLVEYYESTDAESLTNKICSIKAFEHIHAPMIKTESGWIPDFSSRYFTEDFPFGLSLIKAFANTYNINTPIIDKVLHWGFKMIKNNNK